MPRVDCLHDGECVIVCVCVCVQLPPVNYIKDILGPEVQLTPPSTVLIDIQEDNVCVY